MHNEEPQYILLAGESNSGKTTNMLHLVEHLAFLGKVSSIRARVWRRGTEKRRVILFVLLPCRVCTTPESE